MNGNVSAEYLKLELTGVDLAGFLTQLNNHNIPISRVEQKDTLSVCATISSKYIKKVIQLADKYGVTVKTVGQYGLSQFIIKFIKRPVLVAGITFLILLAGFLPTRVLQIEVEGNQNIPDRFIIETAAHCGIHFGASRSAVRSEVVKNKLLQLLPDLQWAGVNTYGCRAVISVAEKESPPSNSAKSKVCSMIATNDGIIESITTTRGNQLCSVGQAVKKGQVLISGYLDCGIKIQATHAEGEVFAFTKRNLTVISPQDYDQKDKMSSEVKKYSIIFGKMRINLSKDSGISTTVCDKMYMEYPLTLPGGFMLPVTLAVEHWKGYNTNDDSVLTNTAGEDLSVYAEKYLSQQMISGKIVSRVEEIDYTNNTVRLTGVYNCLEMIAGYRAEEIIDGEDN